MNKNIVISINIITRVSAVHNFLLFVHISYVHINNITQRDHELIICIVGHIFYNWKWYHLCFYYLSKFMIDLM